MKSAEDILSALINFNTTIDTGDTSACAAYAAGILSSCGAENEIIDLPNKKDSLLSFIRGECEKTIVLHAHLDTAPYYRELDWRFPADRASFIREFICGRGAADCKAQAAVWIRIICKLSQEALKRRPEKSLLLVLTCDEEAGGEQGLKRLIEDGYIRKYTGTLKNIELVIGEGGGFPVPFKGRLLYTFQTGEYEPEECTAVSDDALNEICTLDTAIKKGYYSELIYEYIRDCGPEKKRIDTKALYKGMGGYFEGAEETLTYKKYGALFENTLKKYVQDAKILPTVTPGFSDNRYFRRAGIPVIGFFPFYEKDHIIMHGANEYVSRKTLELAYNVMGDVVKGLIM